MPAPTDKKGVERLLGTVNYLGKFIPNLASLNEPIRVLLGKDIEFQCSHEQGKDLQEIKTVLTENRGPSNHQMRCLTYRPWRSLTARQLSHGLRSKIVNRGQIKIRSSRKGSLGSSNQPSAIQPINVRKESARGIRSQTPRNICEEALSDSTAQTTKNSDENAKVRLQTRI